MSTVTSALWIEREPHHWALFLEHSDATRAPRACALVRPSKGKAGEWFWEHWPFMGEWGTVASLEEAKALAACPWKDLLNPCTAIIVHPHYEPHEAANSRPRLETTGPDLLCLREVHRRPGHFLPVATFEEFVAYKERYCVIHETRRPVERGGDEIAALAARRIVNLIDKQGGFLFSHNVEEIRWRALIAQPECMSDWFEDLHL